MYRGRPSAGLTALWLSCPTLRMRSAWMPMTFVFVERLGLLCVAVSKHGYEAKCA